MDVFASAKRSEIMAQVRGRDTKPELRVRRVAHAIGLRFRLHRKDLPGCPDLLFSKHRLAVFVHGCFWHQHPECRRATFPQTKMEFWRRKLTGNVQRDAASKAALERDGWRVEIIWECETKSTEEIRKRLEAAVSSRSGLAKRRGSS